MCCHSTATHNGISAHYSVPVYTPLQQPTPPQRGKSSTPAAALRWRAALNSSYTFWRSDLAAGARFELGHCYRDEFEDLPICDADESTCGRGARHVEEHTARVSFWGAGRRAPRPPITSKPQSRRGGAALRRAGRTGGFCRAAPSHGVVSPCPDQGFAPRATPPPEPRGCPPLFTSHVQTHTNAQQT